LTKTSKTYNEEKIVSSTMMQGKLDIGMQKTETRSLAFILYKYQLKIAKGFNIRPEIFKLA
jgi:hypothetical protein